MKKYPKTPEDVAVLLALLNEQGDPLGLGGDESGGGLGDDLGGLGDGLGGDELGDGGLGDDLGGGLGDLDAGEGPDEEGLEEGPMSIELSKEAIERAIKGLTMLFEESQDQMGPGGRPLGEGILGLQEKVRIAVPRDVIDKLNEGYQGLMDAKDGVEDTQEISNLE